MRSGRDVPAVDREPLAGPAEAGHHLVGDVDDAVAVADLADAGQVAVRRDQDAGRPGDRLEHQRRDRARTLERDDLLQVLQRPGALLLRRRPTRTATGRGRGRRSARRRSRRRRWPSAAGRRSSGSRSRCCRGSCGRSVSTLCRPVCSRAIRTAFSIASAPPLVKNTLSRSLGRALGDQPGGLGPLVVRVLRRDGAQPRGLLLDRGDDLRVLVADVDVDQLRGEVEVAVAVVVPDVGALRRRRPPSA